MTLDELLGHKTDRSTCLLGRNWICEAGSCVLTGPTGAGKSTVALQMALSWASGVPTWGICPTRPLRTFYVQGEGGVDGMQLMVSELLKGLAGMVSRDALRENFRIAYTTDVSGPKFISWLAQALGEYRPDLIWVDPLFQFFGGDIKDQAAMTHFVRRELHPFADKMRCAWMIVHHENKPSPDTPARWNRVYSGSGSAELANWCRGSLALERVADDRSILWAGKNGESSGLGEGCVAAHHPHSIPLRRAEHARVWLEDV